jgi:hypothetical protein
MYKTIISTLENYSQDKNQNMFQTWCDVFDQNFKEKNYCHISKNISKMQLLKTS